MGEKNKYKIILMNKFVDGSKAIHNFDERNPIFIMKLDGDGKNMISLLKNNGIICRLAEPDETAELLCLL